MKVQPIYDRLVVKRLEEENTTKGGIIIPDTAKEKPVKGEVISVGSGRRLKNGAIHPMTVKAGDKVLFEKWAGSEIKLDGTDVVILREDEVLGIFS